MNRAELTKYVYQANPSVSKDAVDKIIGDTFDAIADEIANGSGLVRIYGFGTFSRKETIARTSVNPKSGATVNVPAKRTMRLVVSKSLVMAI